MKMNILKNLSKKFLPLIPNHFVDKLIEGKVKMPTELNSDYEITIARTSDDLEACFRILHENYVEEGYTTDNPSKMRITEFHLLPTTIVILIRHLGQVVGTMSIIRYGKMEMPVAKVGALKSCQLEELSFEVSSLAISKEHRKNSGELFLWLIKYALHLTIEKMKLTTAFIGVHPKWVPFYRSILGFEELKKLNLSEYSFANNNPLRVLKLDLMKFAKTCQAINTHKKPIHHFYNSKIPAQFIYPELHLPLSCFYSWTPESMEELLIKKSTLLSSLSMKDKIHTLSSYQGDGFRKIFEKILPLSDLRMGAQRFFVQFKVKDTQQNLNFQTYDISSNGISILTDAESTFPEILNAEIELCHQSSTTSLVLKKVRQISAQRAAYRIVNSSSEYKNLISTLKTISLCS